MRRLLPWPRCRPWYWCVALLVCRTARAHDAQSAVGFASTVAMDEVDDITVVADDVDVMDVLVSDVSEPGFASFGEALHELRACFGSLRGCLVVVAVLSLLTGFGFHLVNRALKASVRRRSWWPRAKAKQEVAEMKFRYEGQVVTEDAILENFCFSPLMGMHHGMCFLCMLPVALVGWRAAGVVGQLGFFMAGFADMALDVYDTFRLTSLTFFPKYFRFLGYPSNKIVWVLVCCLHHPLALVMGFPLLLYYPSLPAFHLLAVSLMGAATIHAMTTPIKFALDTETKAGVLQMRVVIVLQCLGVWGGRALIWFPQITKLLYALFLDKAFALFTVCLMVAILMSVFNLFFVVQAAGAARKWFFLPRQSATTGANAEGQDEAARDPVEARGAEEGEGAGEGAGGETGPGGE